MSLVPAGFIPPVPLATERFRFEVLGPEHNEEDHTAWTQSIEHIKASPGFAGRQWPHAVETPAENLASLHRHRDDYDLMRGFAYAVRNPADGHYVGCVYFYPPRTEEFDVDVRSWVRLESADLDKPLHDEVTQWLADCWPWLHPDYARR